MASTPPQQPPQHPHAIARDLEGQLRKVATLFPAVTLTGPRQSGKSTLCRAVFPEKPYANLEDMASRRFATEDPAGFLAQFPAGGIIDEVQEAPALLSSLQVRIDEEERERRPPGRWILTGSQNLTMLDSVSQSLAGRTAVLHLLPLARNEVERFERPPTALLDALVAGGYPRIHDRNIPPGEWLRQYVSTYVDRDVRAIANVGDLVAFERFVALCAGRSSQLINYASLATDAGISQPTAKAWLSVLEASFIVIRVPAWDGNLRKKLVRAPKLHFIDSGLLCWMLGIRTTTELALSPFRGAVFESWVVTEILKHRINAGETGSTVGSGMSYFRDRNGVECDVVVTTPKRTMLVEAKASATPTGDMLDAPRRVASFFEPLKLDVECFTVHAAETTQRRSTGTLLSWRDVAGERWV